MGRKDIDLQCILPSIGRNPPLVRLGTSVSEEDVDPLELIVAPLCKLLDTRKTRHVELPDLDTRPTLHSCLLLQNLLSRRLSFADCSYGHDEPCRVHLVEHLDCLESKSGIRASDDNNSTGEVYEAFWQATMNVFVGEIFAEQTERHFDLLN